MLINRSSTVASLMPLGSQMMSDEWINFSSPNERREGLERNPSIVGNARRGIPTERKPLTSKGFGPPPRTVLRLIPMQPESCHSFIDLVARFVQPV
jgi:hypothetical protein